MREESLNLRNLITGYWVSQAITSQSGSMRLGEKGENQASRGGREKSPQGYPLIPRGLFLSPTKDGVDYPASQQSDTSGLISNVVARLGIADVVSRQPTYQVGGHPSPNLMISICTDFSGGGNGLNRSLKSSSNKLVSSSRE